MNQSSRTLVTLILLIVISAVAVSGFAAIEGGMEQTITPIDQFPIVSKDGTPTIDPSTYVLTVSGLVENTLSLTLDQIKALPSVTETAAMRCVSGPTGVAVWKGALLRTVLEMAVLEPGSLKVVFSCADGYSTDLTVNESLASDVLVCYEMDGQPLPPAQGFPIRIVVPNHWGYKWAKWVTDIRVVNTSYIGYWESRGWSDNAVISGQVDWYYHAVLMTSAGAAGGMAGISGVVNARRIKKGRPYFLDPKLHRYVGYGFAFLVTMVFLWWVSQTLFYRGSIFYTFHGRIGLASVALILGGMAAGYYLAQEKEKARFWHAVLNNSGYLLFLLTIAVGIQLAF